MLIKDCNSIIFSVIIPTYNREELISRSIESVLSQTLKDFEVVVVDDGSKDNTEQVIRTLNDPRIVYIKQENRGATAARNNGVRHARGKFISFLDSDDIWHPLMLEKQLEKFSSDPEIGCVYSDLNVITSKGEIVPFWNPTCLEGFIYKEALTQGFLSPMIVLSVKKQCIEEVGMFDETLPASQDDDICFKLAKRYKFGYIPYQLASVYTDVNNRISGSSKKVSLGWWMLWNKYEEDVINYCGKDVIADHYFDCLRRFSVLKDIEMRNKAMAKYEEFAGGSPFKKNILLFSLKCSELINKIRSNVIRII